VPRAASTPTRDPSSDTPFRVRSLPVLVTVRSHSSVCRGSFPERRPSGGAVTPPSQGRSSFTRASTDTDANGSSARFATGGKRRACRTERSTVPRRRLECPPGAREHQLPAVLDSVLPALAALGRSGPGDSIPRAANSSRQPFKLRSTGLSFPPQPQPEVPQGPGDIGAQIRLRAA